MKKITNKFFAAVLVFIECPAQSRSRFEKLKLKLTTKSLIVIRQPDIR